MMLPTVVVLAVMAMPSQAGGALCAFTVTRDPAPPQFVGPDATVRVSSVIDVKNVSDRPIEQAGLVLATRAGGSAGGDPVDLGTPLEPGKTRKLKGKSARFGDFQAGAAAAEVQVIAVVDAILFDSCLYQPARAYPTYTRPPAPFAQ